MKSNKLTLRTHAKTLLGDLHTPVSIYLKVRDIYPESALLESSDFHGNENSHSYIALQPIGSFSVKGNTITTTLPNGEKTEQPITHKKSVPQALQNYLNQFQIEGDAAHLAGLFGYTTFEAVRHFEDVTLQTESQSENIPDMHYLLYKYLLVINHFQNELTLVELLQEGETPNTTPLETLIENRNFASYDFSLQGEEESPLTDEAYRQMVQQGIAHCQRGDVFQIVLSRSFSQAFQGEDFKVYRALRSVNPSPYLFYFDFGSYRIFGSSPETHCRVEKNRATIDPIAGTFKRTGDTLLDKQLEEQLLADPKENAEHVMLVDLARNDLSRNAHNVAIDFYKEVQYYSHVIHLVSRVSGDILPHSNPIQTYADTFPAGTLSGAPKVRAMELISQIEGTPRGIYGGCIGFIGFNGDLNQAITIRSFISRGNRLYYQAGAGIVAKSQPESELQEVNNKLNALRKALTIAASLKN